MDNKFLELRTKVELLVQEYGDDTLIKAVTILTDKASRPIPAEHIPVLSPLSVQATIAQLDAAAGEALECELLSEDQFELRKNLLRERATLETEVKIMEADAIMELRGEAKAQYTLIAGEKVMITNDQARDAYRRMSSKETRIRMAAVEGELAAIDAQIARIKDGWGQKKEAYDAIKAKANIQAALLTFLR